MNEYVNVLGRMTLIIDVLVLIAAVYCVYHNVLYLIKYEYSIKDVQFRVIVLCMGFAYSLANYQAFKRHLDTFIFNPILKLTEESVDSLLSDRGYMLFTGVFMVLLTINWKPTWFHKE